MPLDRQLDQLGVVARRAAEQMSKTVMLMSTPTGPTPSWLEKMFRRG